MELVDINKKECFLLKVGDKFFVLISLDNLEEILKK